MSKSIYVVGFVCVLLYLIFVFIVLLVYFHFSCFLVYVDFVVVLMMHGLRKGFITQLSKERHELHFELAVVKRFSF